ncbi:hypothetical protein J1614_008405 [Plenodomus biglobosus]|nr:hypothetical protein J1614_008405 [Plenodomus biglobosus]
MAPDQPAFILVQRAATYAVSSNRHRRPMKIIVKEAHARIRPTNEAMMRCGRASPSGTIRRK